MASRANPYGITQAVFNSSPFQYPTNLIGDAIKIGLGRVRFQQDWSLIELTKGAYNWTALDDMVGRCNMNGFLICYPIRHTPSWYLSGAGQWQADPAAWANFSSILAKRYNGQTTANPHQPNTNLFLDYIEIGNEEFDIAHESNWLPIAKAACPAIVAASPNTKIGPCALLSGSITGRKQFLTDTYNYGIAHFFDYWNIHTYIGDPTIDRSSEDVSVPHIISALGGVIKAFSDNKPIRFTEIGWNIAEVEALHGFDPTGDPSAAQEAVYYQKAMDAMRTSGIVAGFDLFTMAYDPNGSNTLKGKSIVTGPGCTPQPSDGSNFWPAAYTIQGYIKQFPQWSGNIITTRTKDILTRTKLKDTPQLDIQDIMLRAGVQQTRTQLIKDVTMRVGLTVIGAITISDTFVRANQIQWGNASDGENWAQTVGSATASIISNEGQVTGASGTNTFRLGAQTLVDVEAYARVSMSAAGDVVGITLRDNGLNSFVRLQQTNTQLQLVIQTPNAFAVVGRYAFIPAVNTFYWMKFRTQGTQLYGKIWQDGTAEPSVWLMTASNMLITLAGQVGVYCSLTASSDAVLFDHFNATVASTGIILPTLHVNDVAMRAYLQDRLHAQVRDVAMRANIVGIFTDAITVTTYAAKRRPLVRIFPKS